MNNERQKTTKRKEEEEDKKERKQKVWEGGEGEGIINACVCACITFNGAQLFTTQVTLIIIKINKQQLNNYIPPVDYLY